MSEMKASREKKVLEKSEEPKLTEVQLRWLGMLSRAVAEKGKKSKEEKSPGKLPFLATDEKGKVNHDQRGENAEVDPAEDGYYKVLKQVGPKLVAGRRAARKDNPKLKEMEVLLSEAKRLAGEKKFNEASNTLIKANIAALGILGTKVGHQDISTGPDKNLVEARRGDKYQNEGFHLGTGVDEGGGLHYASRKNERTRMYDDQLREQAAVYKDEEGNLVNKSGIKLNNDNRRNIGEGYVTDPTTGEVYKFDSYQIPAPPNPQGINRLLDHHSSPVDGRNVAAAGMDKIKDGIVRKVTGESGHYTPKPENIYQQVRGYEDQGVKMRSEELTMLGLDGRRVDIDADIRAKWEKVKKFPGQAKKDDDSKNVNVLTINKNDPEEIKSLKKELRALGVGLDYVDAKAEVFRSTAFLSEQEKNNLRCQDDLITVNGQTVTGADMVARNVVREVFVKLGWDKVTPTHQDAPKDENQLFTVLVRLITNIKKADPKKPVTDIINSFIGERMRLGWDNPNVTRLTQDTSAFGQTGGNVESIDSKSQVMKELKERVTPKESAVSDQPEKIPAHPEQPEQLPANPVSDSDKASDNAGQSHYDTLDRGPVQPGKVGGPHYFTPELGERNPANVEPSHYDIPENASSSREGKSFYSTPDIEVKESSKGNYDNPEIADPSREGKSFYSTPDIEVKKSNTKVNTPRAGTASSRGRRRHRENPAPQAGSISKVNIRAVKEEDKLTSDKLTEDDKLYRELGGDDALLEKRRKIWQKKNEAVLAQILKLQKAIPKAKDDKPQLEEELKKLLKIVKEDDPMPTLVAIGKERKQKGVANLIPELQ